MVLERWAKEGERRWKWGRGRGERGMGGERGKPNSRVLSRPAWDEEVPAAQKGEELIMEAEIEVGEREGIMPLRPQGKGERAQAGRFRKIRARMVDGFFFVIYYVRN